MPTHTHPRKLLSQRVKTCFHLQVQMHAVVLSAASLMRSNYNSINKREKEIAYLDTAAYS